MLLNKTPKQRMEKSLLREKIAAADALVIGAGAGLSAAAGYTYSGERFRENFADFIGKYGFSDMYTAGFYPFETAEEYWAFWSRYILINRYTDPPGDVYERLLRLVGDSDYFVLTTNVDHMFQKAGFDKSRLFYTQGDYGLFQCSGPCHDRTYDNEDAIRKMAAQQRDMRVPTGLLPRCPRCGKPMVPNLRADDKFVQDEGWYAAARRYEEFSARHKGTDIVYLELGVGYNTPGIIKYPFWKFCMENSNAYYISVNMGENWCPPEIADRSTLVNGDIGRFLTLMGV